jgi:hypothetical protein
LLIFVVKIACFKFLSQISSANKFYTLSGKPRKHTAYEPLVSHTNKTGGTVGQPLHQASRLTNRKHRLSPITPYTLFTTRFFTSLFKDKAFATNSERRPVPFDPNKN